LSKSLWKKLWTTLVGRAVRPGCGVSVGSSRSGARSFATLGCFVEWKGQRFGLTCEHPFLEQREGAEVREYDVRSGEMLGQLGRLSERAGVQVDVLDHELDFLLFRIRSGVRTCYRLPPPIGRLSGDPLREADLEKGVRVRMSGAVGCGSVGVVSGFTQPLRFPLGREGEVGFADVLVEVTPTFATEDGERNDPVDFGQRGDSGALVVTEAGAQPLGLLIVTSGDRLCRRGYVLPICRILRHLREQGEVRILR